MPRLLLAAIIFMAAIGMCLLLLLLMPRDTLISDSPDGLKRIAVREGFRHVDRNFRVILIDQQSGAERVIYRSNDQDPRNSQERFVWAKDSSKVALLGDRYFVIPESSLPSGEIVYLVYDLANSKIWCNEVHNRGFSGMTANLAADLFGNELQQAKN